MVYATVALFGYVQGSVGLQKSHGTGNPNPSHKHSSSRHQKSGSKRNPHGGHPFPVPFPYHQPSVQPVFHTMVAPPHIGVPGYAYASCPGPFPSVEAHLVKSGCDTAPQTLVPPSHGVDASRNMQPPARVDPNTYFVNFSNRRPNMPEPGGHFSHVWHHQRALNPRDNIPMQPCIGARALRGPPFFGPAAGFMVGPTFTGNSLIPSPPALFKKKRKVLLCIHLFILATYFDLSVSRNRICSSS